ncbi:MAG: hypothetical protein PHP85_09520 [Gallionella sp.]|nr:hypothetical protein [Gallionella sp.]
MEQILQRGIELIVAGLLGGGVVVLVFKSFISSYMSEKARNLATREDFDHLLEQLRKSTRETESIRNELSSSHWLRQQNWSRREQFYLDLLSELTRLHISLTDRNNYYMEPGSEYNSSIPEQPHYQKLTGQGHAAYQKIQELVGPAAVFLSERSLNILRKLIGDYWEAAEFSSHHAEFLGSAVQNVDYAYVEILAEAKAELTLVEEKSNNSLEGRRP